MDADPSHGREAVRSRAVPRPYKGHRAALPSALLALPILLSAGFLLGACGQATASPIVSQGAPPGWRTYRDSGRYFTIEIPSSWQIGVTTGSGVQGTRTGSTQITTVDTVFREPPVANPSMRLFMAVSYDTFATATVGQQILCGAYKQANTTFAGLRAELLHGLFHDQAWTISTKAALYQVDYGVPADFDNSKQTSLPTPVPAATKTARAQAASAILATFVPIPAQPPQC